MFEPFFAKGRIYHRRREIHDSFGGQPQQGISTPAEWPFILLFTGGHGPRFGYEDKWTHDGVLLYFGEGSRGDMEFVRGNRAIRDHEGDRKDLLLFEVVRHGPTGYGHARYFGPMTCIGYHTKSAFDKKGGHREAIVFELAPLFLLRGTSGPESGADWSWDLAGLRKASLALPPKGSTADRLAVARNRYQCLRNYTLSRSVGMCEGCRSPAPFRTGDGRPFLEIHNLHRIVDGGLDHPKHVAALCPNCHRRAHAGRDAEAFNDELAERVLLKEIALWGRRNI